MVSSVFFNIPSLNVCGQIMLSKIEKVSKTV